MTLIKFQYSKFHLSIINYAPQLEPEDPNDIEQRSNYLSKHLLLFLETTCIHAFNKYISQFLQSMLSLSWS